MPRPRRWWVGAVARIWRTEGGVRLGFFLGEGGKGVGSEGSDVGDERR